MTDLLVAGELNVDVFVGGLNQLPMFGREILCKSYGELAGSSTGNTACTAASLGLRTGVYGKLGTDHFGELVLAALQKYGIDTSLIDRTECYRTGVTVSLGNGHDRAMITYFGDTINAFDAADIPLQRSAARHVHMPSFYLQPRVARGLAGAFERAHQLGMTTSMDAGWAEDGNWHEHLDDTLVHTDFFFPSESEAQAITGMSDPKACAARLAAMGCNVVVKCGEKGSYYCARGSGSVDFYPAYTAEVVETTGAGDSFNAGFLYAWLHDMGIAAAMRMGNAVGALSVQRLGGVENCPTLDEALRTIERGTAL